MALQTDGRVGRLCKQKCFINKKAAVRKQTLLGRVRAASPPKKSNDGLQKYELHYLPANKNIHDTFDGSESGDHQLVRTAVPLIPHSLGWVCYISGDTEFQRSIWYKMIHIHQLCRLLRTPFWIVPYCFLSATWTTFRNAKVFRHFCCKGFATEENREGTSCVETRPLSCLATRRPCILHKWGTQRFLIVVITKILVDLLKRVRSGLLTKKCTTLVVTGKGVDPNNTPAIVSNCSC